MLRVPATHALAVRKAQRGRMMMESTVTDRIAIFVDFDPSGALAARPSSGRKGLAWIRQHSRPAAAGRKRLGIAIRSISAL